ncbi:MAG TPA: DUF177 domain-containing protein [Candidatus Limnocylindrales bacterium]
MTDGRGAAQRRRWAAADALTYNVARLLAEPPGSSRTYRVSGVMLDLGEDLRQSDPVEGTVRVSRTNRGLLLGGHLDAALATECSRCLRPIDVPIEIEIAEEVLPSIDIATGLPVTTSAEPDVARLTPAHELELEPIVRAAIQLAEPIAPVCRADCPGLCSVCGLDLTDNPHGHDEEPIDPRLESLRAFRVDGEPENR